MDRSKKVIFTSHCVLNQNTVVCPLARAKGPYRDIVQKLMEEGIGIHQLPCPEYRHLGLKRKPMTKSQYDTVEFRNLCKKIGKDAVNIMKEYLDNDYLIVGLLGIKGSPSCSLRGEKGILMEELLSIAKDNGISLNLLDVPGEYVDGKDNKEFIEDLDGFLSFHQDP